MSLIQWPFKRKTYPGIKNPRFVSDIQAANEAVMDGLMYLTGLKQTDFAILWGMEWDVVLNTYAPGIIYLKGTFYYVADIVPSGLYLTPSLTDIMQQPFDDGTPRKIYTVQNAVTALAATADTSPIFFGTMAQYRLGLKTMAANIQSMMLILVNLRSAAYLNVGVTPGTVAAGDDARFGYTTAQINDLFALKTDVIIKSGGLSYTPIQGTDPANKAYVDSTSALRMVSGTTAVGDIPPAGKTVTVPFGITLGDILYLPFFTVLSANGDPQLDVIYSPNARNKTTVGFDVYFREGPGANVQNLSIDWIVFHK